MVSQSMSRFFFDLFFDRYVVLDPGGMLFEHPTSATVAADEMARHLLNSRPELRNTDSWIRVRDQRRREVYRSSVDPRTTTAVRHEVRSRAEAL
ncbi:MAG: DUF6894 family protein [Bradyrhizobium sp.]